MAIGLDIEEKQVASHLHLHFRQEAGKVSALCDNKIDTYIVYQGWNNIECIGATESLICLQCYSTHTLVPPL